MEKLIEFLPNFIIYIVIGFTFLRIFRYVCTIKNSDAHEHIIWESLLVGFVLKSCYSIIPISINYVMDIIGMIISTIIIAIILAKIYSSRLVDNLFHTLGVYRTRNKYIWKDLEDTEYLVTVNALNPDTKEAYYGVLIYYEDFERKPQIVLNHYIYWKNYEDIPYMDFSNKPEYVALIDTDKFSQITIQYDSKSRKVKRIKYINNK